MSASPSQIYYPTTKPQQEQPFQQPVTFKVKNSAKQKHDKRMGYKIARFDEQADILDDEIDDIDEEFRALVSNRDKQKKSSKVRARELVIADQAAAPEQSQFSAVEEEEQMSDGQDGGGGGLGHCYDSIGEEYEQTEEYRREREILMAQI